MSLVRFQYGTFTFLLFSKEVQDHENVKKYHMFLQNVIGHDIFILRKAVSGKQ